MDKNKIKVKLVIPEDNEEISIVIPNHSQYIELQIIVACYKCTGVDHLADNCQLYPSFRKNPFPGKGEGEKDQ